MGDIFGGGNNTSNQNYELRGTVDSVDLNSRSVYLTNVSGYNSMLSSGGNGNNVRVYFDDRTPVDYQGQSYRPEDLDRGDQVAVRVDESSNRLYAKSMSVTYNANASNTNGYPSSSYPNNGSYGTTIRGTVNSVDTSRRTITIDRGYGSYLTVEYDTTTPVYYNNSTYRVADLDRGDEIEIRGTDLGSNRLRASDITVTRNVGNGGGSTSSSQTSTLRGTVRYVDTNRHTIELGATSWMSGFTTGTGSGGTITVSYDPNASVDVQGRLYPVNGLEAGDVIEVQVTSPNSSLPYAQHITLIRNARG